MAGLIGDLADRSKTSRRLSIILVHGTWARGCLRSTPYDPQSPRWFETGSSFSSSLMAQVRSLGWEPVNEEPLLWRGRNSLLDRGEAAQELALRLKALNGAPCLLVAHSHGGNVVLRALEELPGEAVDNIRVITMATPFVELFLPRADTHNYERLQFAAFLFLLGMETFFVDRIAPSVPFAASTVVAAAFFALFSFAWKAEQTELLAIKYRQPCLALTLWRSAGYIQFKDRAPQMLVLRGVEDEASLMIASAAALGRIVQLGRDLSHRLWHAKFRAVAAAFGLLLVSVLALVVYGLLYGEDALARSALLGWVHTAGLIGAGLLVGVPAAFSLLVVFARIGCGIAAGRELSWLPNLEVSTSTAPDINIGSSANEGRALRVVTVPRRGTVLKHIRHSIYDDPDVFVAMHPWLVDALTPPNESMRPLGQEDIKDGGLR